MTCMLNGVFYSCFIQWNTVFNILKIVESSSLTYLKKSDKDIYEHLTYFPSETYDLRIFIKCFETLCHVSVTYTGHGVLTLVTVTWVCMCPHVRISTCISYLKFGVAGSWLGIFYLNELAYIGLMWTSLYLCYSKWTGLKILGPILGCIFGPWDLLY